MELNDISALGLGLHAMVNNFQDFQRDGALVGARAYLKPIKFLGLPIISNLTMGGTYVMDMNQRAVLSDRDEDKVPDVLDKEPDDDEWAIERIKDTSRYSPTTMAGIHHDDSVANEAAREKFKEYIEGKDPFSIVGADIGLPIISQKLLSLIVYGQWAMTMDDSIKHDPTKNSGWGLAVPGVQVGVGPLKVNIEYRHFKDQFQGEYFDQTYELDRMIQIDDSTLVAKEYFLKDKEDVTMDGIFARAGLNIANLINVGASYQWMTINYKGTTTGDEPGADQSFTANASVGETIKNILKKAKIADVNAYFFKKNIGTWKVGYDDDGEPVYDWFLERTPFVLTGYKIGFQIASSLVLYWDTQYTFVLDEETEDHPYDLRPEKRLNIETVITF
jgi:hypothetical protein